jgi:hypothetical protein
MKCGTCNHIRIKADQAYHDCREGSPHVVVSGFRPNPSSQESTLGKIMTVWPRVAMDEDGCGKFSPKIQK